MNTIPDASQQLFQKDVFHDNFRRRVTQPPSLIPCFSLVYCLPIHRAGIYVFTGFVLFYFDLVPIIHSKIFRTFPSLFPLPKPNPIDPMLEYGTRLAAERRLLDPDFNYTIRTRFHGMGCTIYGYPSSGGVFIKETANLVDMNFLSLDRFHPTQRSADPENEDEFCVMMRKVGAIWWESERHHETEWYSSVYDYQRRDLLPPTDAQKNGLRMEWVYGY